MMQRWLRLPYRLSILACLAAAALASLHVGYAAGPMLPAGAPSPLMLVCAILLGALALLLWRQHRLALRLEALEQLREEAEQVRLSSGQQQAREQERLRIGRDIHDDLGQHLLTLKIDLSMLQTSTHGAAPQLAQQLAVIARNVDLTIAALRCVIHDLRPPALDAGLQAACEVLLADFARTTGIGCGCDYRLDADASRAHGTLLYHVVQEALANIARHARATHVQLCLQQTGATVACSISDDGIGLSGSPPRLGCGLSGMHERVAAAGGSLHIDSRSGAGTTLRVSLPLPVCHDEAMVHH
ncbi:Oxygen sensor histidine kinase NreB [Janthinobacterium sp. KBS0711]|uniref:sensor histidine kinase n=1 Tax=Janthinobacterium sp. KBS0711 TaxID=1649647 RepID=UPI00063357AC|nr:sensor histidine kinase [Janthinobacterium sp. KBS0711]KKO64690.1 Oxygen sensor histidine kinase NreB [Janthinobacterium sp. KBS0711]TSD72396.1 sensor histidine kinase [Janthinobacterium sp. KBS0711]